jgi:hypothetical protein
VNYAVEVAAHLEHELQKAEPRKPAMDPLHDSTSTTTTPAPAPTPSSTASTSVCNSSR